MGPVRSTQVVQVTSGRVFGEISQVQVGRCPAAKDGTYLWEISALGSELLGSRLIPIATDFGTKLPGVVLELAPSPLSKETANVN
jgi:hypothetical protein